jgi:hypothetical protein
VARFEITHGLNLVLGNLVLRRPVPLAGFRQAKALLTFRAGAGVTIPRPEVEVLGRAGGSYQLGRPGFQAAPGVEFRLARHLFALAEYKFTYTAQRVDIPGGTARVRAATHHGVVGLGVRF